MAKQRMIDTRFWIDDYISELDPVEKLLFLYFLTNPATDISGVYELPLKNIALDTGIDKEMVLKVIKRFELDGKIYYEKGWVAIRNVPKYQNTRNEKIKAGIEAGLNKAPDFIKDKLDDKSYIGKEDLSHLNSNSNSNPNSNSNSNNAPSSDDMVEKLLEELEKGGIKYDYQFQGLEIFEKTGAPPKKKGECIRIAKIYPQHVPRALSFSVDYPNPDLKWKMFLWKLNDLIKKDKNATVA